MPVVHSSAAATWSGDLVGGSGTVRPASGVFPEVPIRWVRVGQPAEGVTNPRELTAAAHATCFCMTLGHELAKGGHSSERLDAGASVAFEVSQSGAAITRIDLTVCGRGPGGDGDVFLAAAEAARRDCPVSRALTGAEIRLAAARLDT